MTLPPDPPVIDSFAPTEGPAGTEVTISGQHLEGSNLTVKFNSLAAVVTSGDDNTIVTIVPAGATDGPITIDVNGYNISSSSDFTVTAPLEPVPIVDGFAPNEGSVGTEVTINGQNFGTDPIVKFNNVNAVVGSGTATQIVTTVPFGATTGRITVKAGALTGVSPTNFIVIPQPVVFGFTPARAAVGAEVTITGANFNSIAGNNIIEFAGVEVTSILSASTESLTVEVPAGATTGRIEVTVNGLTGTSTADFVVVPTTVATDYSTSYNDGGELTISLTVDNAENVKSATLKFKGISEPASAQQTVNVTPDGNLFETDLSGAQLEDPIGVQYFFELTDHGDNVISGAVTRAFLNYPTASAELAVPSLSFGDQVSNYQIIAVPLQLDNANVTSVFSALGEYDIKLWRLFDYSGGTREYPAFNTIVPGKGYWLIVRNSATINPGPGAVVQVNGSEAFQINLVAGWNLIGNPFNFKLSWQDIMDFNSNPAGVENLKGFSQGTLVEIDLLDRYRGGFVFSQNAVTLQIPALRNTSLGGRAGGQKINNSIDEEQWEVDLTLSAGHLANKLGGIGMNPDATLIGKDRFDEVSLPLPDGLDLFEMRFPHPELFTSFNKEVVPTQENYTWEVEVKRSPSHDQLKISWQNGHFGENEKELVLFDPASLETVDMRKNNSYLLSSETRGVQILFGSKEYVNMRLDSQLPWLGKAYPNPAIGNISIPFRVPKSHGHLPVRISIHNSNGLEIDRPVDQILGAGTYETIWGPDNISGLFLVRMQLGGEKAQVIKVIFQ